ncbi:MAG TPA: hypothetical protein VGT98_14975 [Candidatus Elarobacter sp.]|nr:hypothetical protein [Candidatus Elarobacter sp.]HEV2737182.1 hypothetical protein [Candidatus Elarobacter sp.]
MKLGNAQQFGKVPRTCGSIEHRYAKLALVAFDGNTFQLLPGAQKR